MIFGFILNFILYILSWIIPKQKGFILCGGGLGNKFSGNPKYFYLYLHKIQNQHITKYAWITKNKSLYQKMQQQNLPVLYGFSLKGFWSILRAQYLIIESGPAMKKFGHDIGYQRLFIGNFNIIQTWHGSPRKKILLDALKDRGLNTPIDWIYFYLERMELQNISCILAMGEEEKSVLQQAFDNPNVHILGYPKNDILIDGLEQQWLNKDWSKYNKVILYAPTFRDVQSTVNAFEINFLEKLNKFLITKNWIFLIKKHPYDKYLKITNNYSNILDVSNQYEDVQILLAQTDILITDYSSIYIDFLLTKKPILFYFYDYKDYQNKSRKLHYDLFQNTPGGICINQMELLKYLEDIEIIQAKYDKIYQQNLNHFHQYQDSQSSKRLLQYLITDK
jgi:CDP-glycerol glycerophosphotransferase (TagB/SpsB family)